MLIQGFWWSDGKHTSMAADLGSGCPQICSRFMSHLKFFGQKMRNFLKCTDILIHGNFVGESVASVY